MSAQTGPEWWFYHLERSSLERAAAPLIEKCLERDWRVLVVSANAERRARLDETLWSWRDDSFLPHGEAGAEGLDPARQPVLIAPEPENLNTASVALLLDGTRLEPQAGFRRCMVMFDGSDTQTRSIARDQFKAARQAGLTCRYYQQTPSGGWQKAGG
ncbi:MAG: DNA polymerase III subunit chi [Alphaproteobacteria bacterium]|jgi:DNA polymerase-3 subunit chi|nr:DNA polymerase III subunit chi [Alphaproteobacteria bacterium]